MTQAVLEKILVKFLCGIRPTGRAGCHCELHPPVGAELYALQGGPCLAAGGCHRGRVWVPPGFWLGLVWFAWEQHPGSCRLWGGMVKCRAFLELQ